jgi:hypothetical protein
MQAIERFGRTARFDYLSIASKLGMAAIRPGGPYLDGSTGPKEGAILLFDPPAGEGVAALERTMSALGAALGVAGDVLEDATCNWQKSPDEFKPFRV